MSIAAAGDRALLVTLTGASSVDLRTAAERLRDIEGVVAAIVGHESVYVIGTSDSGAVRGALSESRAAAARAMAHHRVQVSFHEEHALDLAEFLARVDVSREAFLQRLPSIRLSVRYLGFRAGFAYLEGWPAEWSIPRRSTSRNHVPAGSFGIAASMAGFYPVDSPGGWNLLGRTAAPLWDPLRDPPNLFAQGDEIEIEPASDRLPPVATAPPRAVPAGEVIAEVIAPGQLTTLVGPPDWSRLEHGVSPGGAFDEALAAMANEAAGNDPQASLLECVLVGPKLRVLGGRRAALCDGEGSLRVFRGENVDIGRLRGMRGYLAIEGGIDELRLRFAEAPTVLRKGDMLYGVVWERTPSPAPRRAGAPAATAVREDRLTIHVMPGPHTPPLPEEWEVTPHLNRVGIRLRPVKAVEVKPPADLPSCGAQFGTLQWHADGSVVALGPDHPVTGGYLQPATVITADRWKLAQLGPGERVRLVPIPSS